MYQPPQPIQAFQPVVIPVSGGFLVNGQFYPAPAPVVSPPPQPQPANVQQQGKGRGGDYNRNWDSWGSWNNWDNQGYGRGYKGGKGYGKGKGGEGAPTVLLTKLPPLL